MAGKRISPLKKGNELLKLLQTELHSLHGARIKLIALFVMGLVLSRNVQLPKIALYMPGKATPASNIRRIERFLSQVKLPKKQLARLIVRIMNFDQHPRWTLAIDRTNWQFGKRNINILMLAICHQGVGIPLFWIFLDKKGNSNQAERKSLLRKFVDTFGAERIGGLLADREFIGKDWVGWLIEHEIPFVIRVKEDQHITHRGKTMSLRSHFAGLRPRRYRQLSYQVLMGNLPVYISAKRLDSGWLFLITPQYNPQAFTQYRQRWQIETLFKALKTQGFHLEQTHITRISRLSRLLSLISIAFAWCYRIGEIRESDTPMRKVKQGTQRMFSLFLYGLNHLTELLVNPLKYKELKKILALLSG